MPRRIPSVPRVAGAPWIALLVRLTLLPASVVLWFMNEAITTQSEAARRSVLEGYRAQLRLVRSRVEGHWRAHAARLNGAADAERRFAQLVSQTADGVVLLHADGSIAYPDRSLPSGAAGAGSRTRLQARNGSSPARRVARRSNAPPPC